MVGEGSTRGSGKAACLNGNVCLFLSCKRCCCHCSASTSRKEAKFCREKPRRASQWCAVVVPEVGVLNRCSVLSMRQLVYMSHVQKAKKMRTKATGEVGGEMALRVAMRYVCSAWVCAYGKW